MADNVHTRMIERIDAATITDSFDAEKLDYIQSQLRPERMKHRLAADPSDDVKHLLQVAEQTLKLYERKFHGESST